MPLPENSNSSTPLAAHEQLGRIVSSHGRHYMVELEDASVRKCFPKGKRGGATVGDYVAVSIKGEEGSIERIFERKNLLYRSDEMRSKQFASNVDHLLFVVAPEPLFSDDLAGRALVGALSAGITPIFVLNKADLPSAETARTRLEPFRKLGVQIIETSAIDPISTRERLMPLLRDHSNLLLGQSAMGKSTLLNALVPDANAHTQEHSQALGAGKHTTTATRLYHLPGGGVLIDSPGFQAFGLNHLEPEDIVRGFPEFHAPTEHCRFYNCTHRHEPGCGVLTALEQGEIAPERHALYMRLLAENEARTLY